jgi:hypothetical protein
MTPLLLALLLGTSSSVTEERVAVVVGANVAEGDDEVLHYADADARRIHRTLIELGGLRPERALLVQDAHREQVRRALFEARGRAAELSAAGRRVVLFFYFSGHGDDSFIHLADGKLPLEEVRGSLASISAELRISFIDACRFTGRAKGVNRGPSFPLLARAPAPRGAVELRATSVGEAAQESDDLGGGVFSHFLLSGMRGAADIDANGEVSLWELYAYVYRHALLRSGMGPALQHAEAWAALSGAGDIVVTRPVVAGATLELPADGEDRYLIFALPSATVMGEITATDHAVLALPRGQFVIERRRRERRWIAQVDLTAGGERRLTSTDFRPVSREELVARGGVLELRSRNVEPFLGVELAPGNPEGPALRAGFRLTYARGSLGLELETALLGGSVESADFHGTTRTLSLAPSLAWRWLGERARLVLAAGVELRYAWESLEWPFADRLRAAGFSPTEDRSYGAAGPRTALRLGVALGHHLSAIGSLGASLLVRREVEGSGATAFALEPIVGAELGIGYAF